MKRVGKSCSRFPELNFLHRMTFDTGILDGKCRLTVVAGTAGFSLFHIGHLVAHRRFTRGENTVMALPALVHTVMNLVAEYRDPRGRVVKLDLYRAPVTFIAVALDGKGV